MRNIVKIILILLMLFATPAQVVFSQTATPSATISPTASAPSPTAIPTETPTLTPTSQPSPTALPTPTAVSTPTPEQKLQQNVSQARSSENTAQAAALDNCGQTIQPGQTKFAKAGCYVQGDIEISKRENGGFIPLYDSDSSTGLEIFLKEAAWIRAPYGAYVSSNSSNGCGVGCALERFNWPGRAQNQGIQMQAGDERLLKTYTVVAGDVTINVGGYQDVLYDFSSDTGLVVLLKTDASVQAPYGATYYETNDLKSARAMVKKVADNMKKSGCGNGCGSVKTLEWKTPLGKFSNLSAKLNPNKASFNFAFSGNSKYYRVLLLTGEPAPYDTIEIWWGQKSPAVVNANNIPRDFYTVGPDGSTVLLPYKYACGEAIRWRVDSEFDSSPIQTDVVKCN